MPSFSPRVRAVIACGWSPAGFLSDIISNSWVIRIKPCRLSVHRVLHFTFSGVPGQKSAGVAHAAQGALVREYRMSHSALVVSAKRRNISARAGYEIKPLGVFEV